MEDGLLYKFYPAHWGRDALYRQRLKVTTLEDINDPFEFLATSFDAEKRAQAREYRDTELSGTVLISFSRDWQDPLLWSHYAENHRGLVLGFEPDDPRKCYPVTYGPDRVRMEEFGGEDKGITGLINFITRLQTHKFTSWEYEQETRVFPAKDGIVSENGLMFYPFARLGTLKRVILGVEYKPIGDTGLTQALRAKGIEIIPTRLGYKEFKVHDDTAPDRDPMM